MELKVQNSFKQHLSTMPSVFWTTSPHVFHNYLIPIPCHEALRPTNFPGCRQTAQRVDPYCKQQFWHKHCYISIDLESHAATEHRLRTRHPSLGGRGELVPCSCISDLTVISLKCTNQRIVIRKTRIERTKINWRGLYTHENYRSVCLLFWGFWLFFKYMLVLHICILTSLLLH